MIHVKDSTIKLLKQTEGFSALPYSDGYGYSIGYGHYIGLAPRFEVDGVTYSNVNPMSQNVAERVLKSDLQSRANALNKVILNDLSEKQGNALLKWSFSLSPEKILESELPKLIQQKKTQSEISNWWRSHYITVKGQIFKPLQERRESEIQLFFSDRFPYTKSTGEQIGIFAFFLFPLWLLPSFYSNF